ncbi:hypothetical protein CJ305_03100 [Leeuwenhoekiella nanhaiensis]|uniref:Uncharacterized protein n=1 Tax=Leeuwenhoekiella nanhaiensis TaxID=1655491 RepID=A0A2G1VWV9_9FLAO|nr:hypothetical protein CJ305_03100 [Leeuwenhoekiella nanhaiensis]
MLLSEPYRKIKRIKKGFHFWKPSWAMRPRSFGGTHRHLIPNREAENKKHKKRLPFLEAFVGNEAPKFRGNPPTPNSQ